MERCVEAISSVVRAHHIMWSRLRRVIACICGSVMRTVSFSALFQVEPEENRSTARQDVKVARVTRDPIWYRFNHAEQVGSDTSFLTTVEISDFNIVNSAVPVNRHDRSKCHFDLRKSRGTRFPYPLVWVLLLHLREFFCGFIYRIYSTKWSE